MQARAVAAAQRPVSGLAVDEPPGEAGDRGRRAERDDGADRHPGAVDGGEERELVDGDRAGDHRQLAPRPGRGHGRDGARDQHQERAADGDPHRRRR